MSKPGNKVWQPIPLEIVGGTKFGRYPKISQEQTWNLIISDQWMVPFAGYEQRRSIDDDGQGRSIFGDNKTGKMFVVVNDSVYYFDTALSRVFIGTLETTTGDVFISANNVGQVAISDKKDIWIYNDAVTPPTFTKALTSGLPLDFRPGFITYQNGRFLVADLNSNDWRLSEIGNGANFPNDAQHVGKIETKNTNAQAVVRVPGKGNEVLVFGSIVAEPWFDVGAQLFPYQRSTNSNIDYGCINPATIAESDSFVVWLGFNEKSGATIMMTDGAETKQISNDGINFRLANLTDPSNSFGFIFRQDGHVLYVLTFPDDDVSYLYDFNTGMFFTVSDPYMGRHIAKRVTFFNGKYYFVSFIDGNLYELSSDILTADGQEIPRIRICPPIRLPDQSRFVIAALGFTVEQGHIPFDYRNTEFIWATEDYSEIVTEDYVFGWGSGEDFRDFVPVIDLTLSKDGGVSFGSAYRKEFHPIGQEQNKLIWRQLGSGNDVTPQLRFWAKARFVATNGLVEIYQ